MTTQTVADLRAAALANLDRKPTDPLEEYLDPIQDINPMVNDIFDALELSFSSRRKMWGKSLAVVDVVNDPPSGLTVNDTDGKWIVGGAPSGAFVGHEDAIATWDGAAWSFEAPVLNERRAVVSRGSTLVYAECLGRGWAHDSSVAAPETLSTPPSGPSVTIGARYTVGPSPTGAWAAFPVGSVVIAASRQASVINWKIDPGAALPANTPPASPSVDDVCVVGPSPTGAWAAFAGEVVLYDGAAWVVQASTTCFMRDKTYWSRGPGWGGAAAAVATAVASGVSASASQAYSYASGFKAVASTSGATAVGANASASGMSATALGSGASAKGATSFAAGMNASAEGGWAFTLGNNSRAFSNGCASFGNIAASHGQDSVAIGSNAVAAGASAVAAGSMAISGGDDSVAVGARVQNQARVSVPITGSAPTQTHGALDPAYLYSASGSNLTIDGAPASSGRLYKVTAATKFSATGNLVITREGLPSYSGYVLVGAATQANHNDGIAVGHNAKALTAVGANGKAEVQIGSASAHSDVRVGANRLATVPEVKAVVSAALSSITASSTVGDVAAALVKLRTDVAALGA